MSGADDLGVPAPTWPAGNPFLAAVVSDDDVRSRLRVAHRMLCEAFAAGMAAGYGSHLLGLLGEADRATLAALRDLQ